MKINKESIIDSLSLMPFGGKDWMQGADLPCPECNKAGKFGIMFSKDSGVAHCFRCDYTANLIKFLRQINRKDLILFEQEISLKSTLKPLKKQEEALEEIPEVDLPKGYERIYFDTYLKNRNFKGYQYDQFEVGITTHFLEKRLHNYLIFVLKQKGKIVGWLARSKYSKEWHKNNLERSKLGEERLFLRYINSTGTDFERIVGGFDEITKNTHTVIVTEGIFDKTNVSNLLKTNESEELKVIFTFGNKFSPHQIQLLEETNVETVILMYDPGTIKQSKKYSMELSKFFNVYVCDIKNENTDPGNINSEDLNTLLLNMKNYIYFYTTKITQLKL